MICLVLNVGLHQGMVGERLKKLKLAKTIGQNGLPKKISVLGVGRTWVGIGRDLSPEVLAAIPKAAEKFDKLGVDTLNNS